MTSPPAGASERPAIIVVGDVMLDVVVRLAEEPAPDSDARARIHLLGGGAGGNVAAWLAALHAPVTLVARIGADEAGQMQAAELAGGGVRCRLAVDQQRPTGTVVVIATTDGRRTMYTERGANLRLSPADLPELPGGGHLHLSGYVLLEEGPRPAGLEALRRARTAGLSTSVDASSAAPLARVGAGTFARWVDGVDVLRANLDEARILLGEELDPAEAAHRLAERHPVAVITAGAQGAWAAAGGEVLHAPAEPAEVVDPVGAGDALTAGWLARWTQTRSREPAELQAALHAGVTAATAAVRRAGARPATAP